MFKLGKGRHRTDFVSVSPGESKLETLGPGLIPFLEGSVSCGFRWWVLPHPPGRAAFAAQFRVQIAPLLAPGPSAGSPDGRRLKETKFRFPLLSESREFPGNLS